MTSDQIQKVIPWGVIMMMLGIIFFRPELSTNQAFNLILGGALLAARVPERPNAGA